MVEVLAILGLAVASALWVVVQRWARRVDPEEPGVTRCCGACSQPCDRPEARAPGAARTP